jgi:tryptophanyl-tRNA synthetase
MSVHLPRAITGDRPTGALHLGHFAGSLRARVSLQDTHDLIVLVADSQALTDNAGNPQKIAPHIPQVMKDYLAVGLDPNKTTFVLQSAVPELAELTMLLLNMVSVGHLERNPTVRAEIVQRDFQRVIPAGFLCYPAAQAADIIGLGSGIVPVGADQLPMIELANTLVDRLNAQSPAPVFSRCQAMLSTTPRLPGVDGQSKMGKSAGNAIGLDATPDQISAAVHAMYTDPAHIKISDPGKIEGNVVFAYLDAFDPDVSQVAELKAQYQAGGLGDMSLKRRLTSVLEDVLAPIRHRRNHMDLSDTALLDLLRHGSRKARRIAACELEKAYATMGVLRL